jgi:hypothetical protein
MLNEGKVLALSVLILAGCVNDASTAPTPSSGQSAEGVMVGETAYFKAMISDLRNLAARQKIYYSNVNSYTNSLMALDMAMAPSVGVTIHLFGASTQGWAATSAHAALATTQSCGIYYGMPSSFPGVYVTTPGVVKCTNE